MKNICIYTVITGNYDCIKQPQVVSKDVDYILFVKKGTKNDEYIGVWKVEEINSGIKDNIRLSRFPKIVPHKTCLKKYSYSLYIDANIVIVDKYVYERIKYLTEKRVLAAFIKHPARDCVYQETYNNISGCKTSWALMLKQFFFFKYNNVPKHAGLFEANVIFRNHNNSEVIFLDELWWNTYMCLSKRDQAVLSYSFYKSKLPICYFLPEEYSTINHYAFKRLNHNMSEVKLEVKIKRFFISYINDIAKKILKE